MTDKQKQDRDKQLCRDWIDWHDSDLPKQEPVSAFILRLNTKYNLAETTIYLILRQNSNILLEDKNWEKCKRVFRLKREIAQKEKSNRDVADLLDQLRIEIEGHKVNHSGTVSIEHIIFFEEMIAKIDKVPNRVNEYVNQN
jgi:hypothetical protein